MVEALECLKRQQRIAKSQAGRARWSGVSPQKIRRI